MQEEVNLKISRFIDGDLGHDESLSLLKKIQSDESLKQRLGRYQAISQAIKTDEYCPIRPDFFNAVSQQIQLEPTYLLPQLKQHKEPKRTKLFAVAASTIAVAVLVGQSLREGRQNNQYPTLTATAIPQQQMAALVPQSDKPQQQQKRPPLTAQFNDYLQAHNSSVYTNGEANFKPYTTVTSYGRE